jgi:hypothetical protein
MTARPLRVALGANLVFSTVCALTLLVASDAVAAALGAVPGWATTALGFGLLGFAALVALALWRASIGLALLVSGLDLAWVVATAPTLALPGPLGPEGKTLVAAVAVVVGSLGFLQLRGIRALLASGQEGEATYRYCVRLRSAADPDRLWAAIRDLGAMSRYSVGLRSSRLVPDGEPTASAVRVCTDLRGRSWQEEVVSMNDANRTLVLRFRTEAEDFPFPFAKMLGGWKVEAGPAGMSEVEVWWTVRPKARRLGWLLLAIATIPLDRALRRIVAAMEDGGFERSQRTRRLPALAPC